MRLASVRLIVRDIKSMTKFYEDLTGQSADWLAPVFSELVTSTASLAIGDVKTVSLFKEGSAEPCANRTAILEFQVADVDTEYARLKDQYEVVHEPKMMPWGNKTVQFRDPEGNLVSLYTPVTDDAKKRFSKRG